jgi:hypothetical protein
LAERLLAAFGNDLPFSVRDPATGRFRIAFRVFCAAGFEQGRPKLWRVEAFPDASQANWEAFLRALEGAPRRVVCDNHFGLNGAVRAAFPNAELYFCEWHLRHALERLMAKIRRSDEHRGAIDALLARVEAAFTGPAFWASFVRDAQAADIPRLSDWLEGAGRIVEDQFHRRGLRSLRPADMRLSTSPMDGLIGPIRDALHPRRYGLKNRRRTNRLLLLMQLHANRHDDPLAFASDIRAWLELNGGRPRISRRSVADPAGRPSPRRHHSECPAGCDGGPPLEEIRSRLRRLLEDVDRLVGGSPLAKCHYDSAPARVLPCTVDIVLQSAPITAIHSTQCGPRTLPPKPRSTEPLA